jgi:hypothetical protein
LVESPDRMPLLLLHGPVARGWTVASEGGEGRGGDERGTWEERTGGRFLPF